VYPWWMLQDAYVCNDRTRQHCQLHFSLWHIWFPIVIYHFPNEKYDPACKSIQNTCSYSSVIKMPKCFECPICSAQYVNERSMKNSLIIDQQSGRWDNIDLILCSYYSASYGRVWLERLIISLFFFKKKPVGCLIVNE